MKKMTWKKLTCTPSDLNLNITLGGGQSFRWQKNDCEVWQGVMSGHVWSLKQDYGGNLLYSVHGLSEKGNVDEKTKPSIKRVTRSKKIKPITSANDVINLTNDYEAILNDYFQLRINLPDYYSQWSSVDSNFKDVAIRFPGVRILRQDPTENLISFICSSNNNIPRITSMVEKLCTNYGKEILEHDGQRFYSFPTLESLAQNQVEEKLRSLGFGYRAKFIHQSAKYILDNHPPGWLESLRRLAYKEAHTALTQLPGVGAKVADCVCLMSLDKLGAIPVDTHVWQITVRDYLPQLKGAKSLTDRIYQQIGDFYRERFGEYAGWANTVLFAADLRQFKNHNKMKNGE